MKIPNVIDTNVLMDHSVEEIKRPQSPEEEFANSLVHGFGLVAALFGAPFLMTAAVRNGDFLTILSAGVFSATTVLLYLMSTLYHALPTDRGKELFHLLDHIAIYLLIAGTYTPFTLGVLRGTWGWTLFGLVWGLSGAGAVIKTFSKRRRPILSTCVYIGMGWLVLAAARPLWLHVPREGLILLFLGGIAYTFGVTFYAARQIRYCHFIWHLFVLAGTVSHFFAVLWYST